MQEATIVEKTRTSVARRAFLKNAGGAAAFAAAALAGGTQLLRAQGTSVIDTPQEIFTAALVAEDLANVFYYNVLTGPVIQNANLAGPGGSAKNIAPTGQADDVGYLRAALYEEFQHALLFRQLLGSNSNSTDPFQTFYFDSAAFSDLDTFVNTLVALEQAFIGAYLAAILEFSTLAAQGKTLTFGGQQFTPGQLAYFAQVSATIMGVECEHRALGRSINPLFIPANNTTYESTDGILSVFNGPSSAVAALTPFITPGSGKTAYPLKQAHDFAYTVWTFTAGNIPAPPAS
ncbi:ferritin-like domain-containing protein [Paracidobacterium acidisoli]|nr:ferritin-like domain-containing protein [Paracidobacterium acidisoli]MBT9332277.1 ferritin-like domain-containing protein [Paracidobacterium acidisoli]